MAIPKMKDFWGVPNILQKFYDEASSDDSNVGSFQAAISPVLLMGQLFGVLPVCGIRSKHPVSLKFKWICFRTIYAMALLLGLGYFNCVTVYWMFNKKIEFGKFVMIVFYTCNLVSLILFFRLAFCWREIMILWWNVERELPQMKTFFNSNTLARRIKATTIFLMSLSLVEYLLSIYSATQSVRNCDKYEDQVRAFYSTHLSQFAYVMKFNHPILIFAMAVNTISTFIWSYINLFVILVSITLATRFKQINDFLGMYKGKIVPEIVWKHQRSNYRNLRNLTETIDVALGKIILISVGNNLFFICVQLLNSLNKMATMASTVYFWFSLLFVIGRTLALSLYSAEINDESKKLMDVFRAVPQVSWCFEVKRFSEEVYFDNIALSGMKFFFLTRKLVLTVVGTIVTYELVLMQFHQDNGVSDKDNPCG